ncbi:MAG: S41 family peptidase [Gammaproteobacteria bacterium]|nr:S41 family peptidase [Gammaproteobacteria bacterium]
MRILKDLNEFSLRTSIVSIAAGIFLAACGGSGDDGPPPSLSVSATSIDADAGGENVSVSVSNSGGGSLNWTASIPSGVDWARISSGSSGTNAGTVQIEVDANDGAAREFELTVSASGSASRTVTISQAEAPPVIDLSVVSTDLEGDGGSVTVQVSNTGYGTMDWTASLPEDMDWAFIESGESGTDSREIVVRYGLNGGADRELEITVTASAASNSPQSLALSQDWFGASACTYPAARKAVFDLMEEVYYFNDESEQAAKYGDLVLEDHNTLDAMLDELRWKPETHDRGFSYWLTKIRSDMIFAGEAYVFGFRVIYIVDQNRDPVHLEILDVYQGSPAGKAGFQRGDKILSLNGKAIDSLSFDQIGAEFGPNEEGHEVTFELEKVNGDRSTLDVAKDLVTIPTVPEEHATVFDTDAGKAGYVHFRTFFGDANERLLEEFAEFNRQGVRHLIVDLRYNGGGSVPIAYGLATLIGGPELFEGGRRTVLSRRIHNDLLEGFGWNETAYFGCGVYGSQELVAKCENESSLRDLENVVFITSRSSASASELVATAMQPHENVTLIGERTYGKPVGQYGFDFCLEDPGNRRSGLGIMWPVSFATVNADGFEDYYDGLAVECEVPDDRASQLGTAEEGRIAAALRFIETGSCDAPASARAAKAQEASQVIPPQDPIQQHIGY